MKKETFVRVIKALQQQDENDRRLTEFIKSKYSDAGLFSSTDELWDSTITLLEEETDDRHWLIRTYVLELVGTFINMGIPIHTKEGMIYVNCPEKLYYALDQLRKGRNE
jgi:hypothetical protein